MLRVLHLTDPHLFADPQGALRGTVTLTSLTSVLTHYQDGDWRAHLVVVTGDLVQDDSEAAYEHFRQRLESLELPVYILPGNHDIRALMQRVLAQPPFHYCESLERDDWLVACIDSCVDNVAGGVVTEIEYQRLEALVEHTTARHVMVCLHHPPVSMGSRWLDTVGLDNGPEFLGRLSALKKVRLVIFGHVHQNYDANHDGMRVIATPSTCRQFAPGSDEFAVDDNPPAYRRINLYPDGSFDAELIWVPSTPVEGRTK